MLGRRAALELLFFGCVRQYKGIDVLVEAMAGLPDVDFHLQVAGDFWVNRQNIERQIAAAGITERVTLVARYVDEQEAAGMITRADAMVLPYREATGSGVAALTLRYQTPVVASRVGGLADVVVEGETGFLIELGDPDDLARGIRRLLEPRDWWALIGKYAATVSWAGMVDALVDAIESASGVL